MKTETLLKKIDEEQLRAREEAETEGGESRLRFLIVRLQDRRYAFHAEQIREIVIDPPVYFVPFTPPYIRGFINRHGEPYTVFDLNVIFEKEGLESETYLISRFDDDQIAFQISDVTEILSVPQTEIRPLSGMEGEADNWFSGAISAGDRDIFIMNIGSLVERLERDLETV